MPEITQDHIDSATRGLGLAGQSAADLKLTLDLHTPLAAFASQVIAVAVKAEQARRAKSAA